eukprot:NODE_3786_length_882_cov_7.818727_g3147_i0.p7 GENE.NODE_3786_length_882_cov_7.818727_g3147_i0~~NODE_3786_length_882_cov_7.818727_g3147_i0.p7  ORF type:complete len:58 (-),score=2.36 NODE_3786_length_882_cov_7.818727_g3147_i0:84-257(-)
MSLTCTSYKKPSNASCSVELQTRHPYCKPSGHNNFGKPTTGVLECDGPSVQIRIASA